MTKTLRFALGAVLACVALHATSGPAAAASSTAGACTTDHGVTVVVDFSALGGNIVERCDPGPIGSHYTGWDALTDAGFSPQAPARFPGFVCRLSGKPSASQSLSIPGNPDYHEQCVNTPPSSAFWGYWYAKNGGPWTYSSVGAANHDVIDGGYEGWAFALNSGGHPPTPGIAPRHPVATPTTVPTTASPSAHRPRPGRHHHGSSAGSPATSSGSASTPTTGPPMSPSDEEHSDGTHKHGAAHPSAEPSTANPSTASAAGPTSTAIVTGEVPAAADASSSSGAVPTILGIAVLVALGVGAGVTAWRRRTRRG